MAQVVGVAVARLTTPLNVPFVTALRRTTTLTSVVVRVTDDEGCTGFGEAPQVWQVTGESLASIEACVLGPLADLLLGWSLDQPAHELSKALADAVAGNTGAKAACDVAMADLRAKRAGMPLHRLLGATASAVATDMTVAADAPPETAAERVAEGFRHLKVKVGIHANDLDRVKRIYEEADAPIRIRIDANQSWNIDTAISAITTWLKAGVDIEFLEQPLPRWDLRGHATLRQAIPVPVMLDESVFSKHDLHRALEAGGADLINIKLAKSGGLHAGLELARDAQRAGLSVMIGSMLESNLGVSSAAVLAAIAAPDMVHDLDAAWWSIDIDGPDTPYRGHLYHLSDSFRPEDVCRIGKDQWAERSQKLP